MASLRLLSGVSRRLAPSALSLRRISVAATPRMMQLSSLHRVEKKRVKLQARGVQTNASELTRNINATLKACLDKYNAASREQIFHWTHYGLATLTPAAFILSPSLLNWPVDLALGLVIPIHMQLGLTNVIEDYVPRQFQELATIVMFVVSALTALGLLKINLCGSGITESFKSLWRAPPAKKALAN